MMRIAIDMTYPNKIRTGIKVYTDNLLKSMKKLDSKNEYIFVSAPSFKPSTLLSRITNMIVDLIWRQIALPYILKKQKIDILYSPCFFAPLVLPCALIVTVYDVAYLYYSQVSNLFDLLWFLYFRYSILFAIKRADKIIVPSNHTKKDILKNFAIPSQKVEVIYGGVASRYTHIKDTNVVKRIHEKYGLDSECKIVLFVGELNYRKNITTLLKAFHLFRKREIGIKSAKYKLVLCGQKGKAFSTILAVIEKLNLSNDVIFLGHIPDDDMPLLYNAATLFVFPSLYEGFGLPPLEAMSCGCPVITSNVSSLPEVVGTAGILVDPSDASAFAEAMMQIVIDKSIRERMVRSGLIQSKNFSWENSAHKLYHILQQLCKND